MRAAILLVLAAAVAACDDPMGASLPADYFVSATSGSDTYDGSSGAPFKTITKALSVADSGDTIVVYPGRYDAALGEVFPLQIPAWVELIGDEANKGGGTTPTLIIGGDTVTLGVVAITILPGPHTVIAGFTVTDSAPVSFPAGIQLESSDVTIRNNRIVNTISAGIYITAGSQNHIITGNVITGNGNIGLGFIGGGVGSRVENNVITGNAVGVEYDSDGGDLGGGAATSAGGNIMSCNTRNDVWTNSPVTISAANNKWDHVPPTEAENSAGIDFYKGDSTAVLVATGATLATAPCT